MFNPVRLLPVAAALLLAACGQSAPAGPTPSASRPAPSAAPSASRPAPSASKPPASASALTKLNASYTALSSTTALPWIAKGAGLFQKQGLDVTLSFLSPATLT
ncbi:MAG TPA: hypothetical protein VNL71_00110, partial [Chloroflexota bacterium]|nr:hypothetical protein [Chloroflexota bacterium]